MNVGLQITTPLKYYIFMNSIVDNIVRNAHLLVENQKNEPITKTNPYLYNVSHLCITNRDLMGQIPAKDCGFLAFAYLHILDLTDDSDVFQIYSSICYYYTEKALLYGYLEEQDRNVNYAHTLNTALANMNIGARSLCRTFAQAQGLVLSNYINFNDLYSLPVYVKQILLCEYSYFLEFEAALAYQGVSLSQDPQMVQRFDFLKQLAVNSFFDEFAPKSELHHKAKEIRKKVYEYAASKIEKGDIVFI